jgi:phosphoglycerate-specific signal transduction histidine kinase
MPDTHWFNSPGEERPEIADTRRGVGPGADYPDLSRGYPGTIKVVRWECMKGIIPQLVENSNHRYNKRNSRKLFTPFYTTKPPGKDTGLGLSIIYGIVKTHRGDIRVHSQEGKGSEFTVVLPIRLPDMGRIAGHNGIG